MLKMHRWPIYLLRLSIAYRHNRLHIDASKHYPRLYLRRCLHRDYNRGGDEGFGKGYCGTGIGEDFKIEAGVSYKLWKSQITGMGCGGGDSPHVLTRELVKGLDRLAGACLSPVGPGAQTSRVEGG